MSCNAACGGGAQADGGAGVDCAISDAFTVAETLAFVDQDDAVSTQGWKLFEVSIGLWSVLMFGQTCSIPGSGKYNAGKREDLLRCGSVGFRAPPCAPILPRQRGCRALTGRDGTACCAATGTARFCDLRGQIIMRPDQWGHRRMADGPENPAHHRSQSRSSKIRGGPQRLRQLRDLLPTLQPRMRSTTRFFLRLLGPCGQSTLIR
jgi:hypothetical protein